MKRPLTLICLFVAIPLSCTCCYGQIPTGRFVDLKPVVRGDGVTVNANDTEAYMSQARKIFRTQRTDREQPWESDFDWLEEVNADQAQNPFISEDGLTLYFDGVRADTTGHLDLYTATRSTTDDRFGSVVNLGGEINGPHVDAGATVSSDGLTLYFFSMGRGNSYGESDIYQATRSSTSESFGKVTNLGPNVNGPGHDTDPAISDDGLTLIYRSNHKIGLPRHVPIGDLYVATRESIDEQFGTPVNLDDFSMGSFINEKGLGKYSPELSSDWPADGAKLYYSVFGHGSWEMTWRNEELKERMSVNAPYNEKFDSASSSEEEPARLPQGWTFQLPGAPNKHSIGTETAPTFPPFRNRLRPESVFLAGEADSDDHALVIGDPIRPNEFAPTLQFTSVVEATDADAFQFGFDLEAWFAERNATTPGEAVFDVTVEVDSGDGFVLIDEIPSIGTGTVLTPPESAGLVNGNLDENRMAFESDVTTADLPLGSILRFQWKVPEGASTGGWAFGIDDFRLNLMSSGVDCNADGQIDLLDANCATLDSLTETLAAAQLVVGDIDADGHVGFGDFLKLSSNYNQAGRYSDGDLNKDGRIQFTDFLLLSQNYGIASANAASVPEPRCFNLLIAVGLMFPLMRHWNRKW